MLYQVKHSYQFFFAYSNVSIKKEPRLLCLNAFVAYLTLAVSSLLKRQGVTLSVIPGGCTGYIQPLDVSLNKPLKDLIKEEQDNYFDKHIKEQQQEKFNIGQRKILLTHQVAKAQKRLYLEYKDTIINTFRSVGLSLNPNGSKDIKLKIKGIPDIQVSDYHQNDLPSQQEEAEKVLALAKATDIQRKEEAKLLRQDILAESDVEEIRGPRSQRTKRLLARDCYFTTKEAKEGNPLVVSNPTEETTDSKDNLADSQDNNNKDNFNPNVNIKDIEMVQKDHHMS